MNKLNHVAFIMDGNGRWGLKKKNNRNYGHLKGVETVRKIIKTSIQLKIPIKIGFQSPIADDLYSVVIQPLENSFLEESYQVVEKILGIYPE